MSLLPIAHLCFCRKLGVGGRGEASDGVFGYVNSHRQKLVETSGGSKGERVFAFRELAEMYIFGGRWWDRQVCTRGHPNSRDCCMPETFKVDTAMVRCP